MGTSRLGLDHSQVPAAWDDTKAPGSTLQSSAVDLEDTVESIISQLQNMLGETKWYDTPADTINNLEGRATLEGKNILKRKQLLVDVAVTGGNSFVLLGAGEFPSEVKAIATSVKGAVTAQLAGSVGSHDLAEIAGPNALQPKNLVAVRDGTTGDEITSAGRTVWGLLQVGSSGTDGTAFAASGAEQGQISFVRPNATYDDFELCPSADIGGKTINYSYVIRNDLNSMPESAFLPESLFADAPAAAAVSMDGAYDGGSIVDVDDTDVEFRLTDTKEFSVTDLTGAAKILRVQALSGGDEVEINGLLDMNGDIDGGVNKAEFNSVQIGNVAGQIDRTAGDLILKTITSGDVRLESVDDVIFKTVRQTTDLPLDDATAGPISALPGGPHASIAAAIKHAIETGSSFVLGVYVHSGGVVLAGTNVPGVTSPVDYTSPHSFDMNTPANVDTFIIFNGRVLYGGNASVNNDVYPGTTPASGDLKFAFNTKNNDVIITLQLG